MRFLHELISLTPIFLITDLQKNLERKSKKGGNNISIKIYRNETVDELDLELRSYESVNRLA